MRDFNLYAIHINILTFMCTEVRDTADQNVDLPDLPLKSSSADELQEEMFYEIY